LYTAFENDIIKKDIGFIPTVDPDKDDYDLSVTMIQKTHDLGGYDMTPHVTVQTSSKVVHNYD